jgi:two-component system cell cycle sensor histidine kinase/response regulator CckA
VLSNPTGGTRPIRLLVVDDEAEIRAVVQRVLNDAGYATIVAPTGPAALSIVANEGAFDLYVIDLLMPEMRGDELIRQLRERDPDTKVLYYTGYADLFEANKRVGVNEAFLDKPASAAELREAVSLLIFEHRHGPSPLSPQT